MFAKAVTVALLALSNAAVARRRLQGSMPEAVESVNDEVHEVSQGRLDVATNEEVSAMTHLSFSDEQPALLELNGSFHSQWEQATLGGVKAHRRKGAVISGMSPSATGAVSTAIPPAPYTFQARLWYQFHLVRASAARKLLPDGLNVISLFGWTLGGVFVASWDESPLGPYREVVVLPALVWGWSPGKVLPAAGAWPGPLFVSKAAAVEAGAEVFGIGASLAKIVFCGEDDEGCEDSSSRGVTFHSDSSGKVAAVNVAGGLLPAPVPVGEPLPPPGLTLGLASLTGLAQLRGRQWPLAQYSLEIDVSSFALAPTITPVNAEGGGEAAELTALLATGPALFAATAGPTMATATAPEPVPPPS